MSESNQPSDENKDTGAGTTPETETPEQQPVAAEPASGKSAMTTKGVFDNLQESQSVSDNVQNIDMILDIPVKLSVELGRTKMSIKELLKLSQGSVIRLEALAGVPLHIHVNGYLIAEGEIVVVSDKYGVRITDIITPSERMRRLSQ